VEFFEMGGTGMKNATGKLGKQVMFYEIDALGRVSDTVSYMIGVGRGAPQVWGRNSQIVDINGASYGLVPDIRGGYRFAVDGFFTPQRWLRRAAALLRYTDESGKFETWLSFTKRGDVREVRHKFANGFVRLEADGVHFYPRETVELFGLPPMADENVASTKN